MELIECSNCGALNPDYDVNWLESEQRWVCYSCEDVISDYDRMDEDIEGEEWCPGCCEWVYPGECQCS